MIRTRRAALAIAAALALSPIAALAGAATLAYAAGARGICESDDQYACVWIGPVQGNGDGPIVISGPDPAGR